MKKQTILTINLLLAGLIAQNNALDFDGTNDYITIPYNSSHDMNTTLTIEAWVYPTDTGWNSIVMKGNYGYGFAMSGGTVGGTANNCGGAASSSGRKLVFWDQSSCSSSIYSTDTYSLNTWQHVVVTVEDVGSTLTINFYIDGELDGPYTSNQTAISNGGSSKELYIGPQGECLCNYHQGKLDEVRIWNDARTQAEIKANMHKELSGSESNLVAYYKLNESSGTTAVDETSNSNDGTLTNMDGSTDWVSTPNYDTNYALDFDGSDDYVTTPIDADLQAMPSTTWSGWIKPTGRSGWQVIFGMEDGGWDRFLIIESGGLGLSMGSTSGRWQTGVSVTPGSWQHVVVVYDNGSMRFYHNGTEYTSSSTEGSHSSSGTFTIGGNQNGSGNFYTGVIDEVAVWDEALTASEITAVYNSGSGLDVASNTGNYNSSSNLVGYYKMNDGRGTSLLDLTTNNNAGTISNMDGADWVSGVTISSSVTALSIYGESTTTSASHVSKNGAIGSGSGLDANGQIKN